MATFGGFLAGLRDIVFGRRPPATPPSRPPSPPPPPEEPPEEPPEPGEPEPPEESEVRFRPGTPGNEFQPDAWIIYFPDVQTVNRIIVQHIHTQTMRVNALIDFRPARATSLDRRGYKRGPAGTGHYLGTLIGRASALDLARRFSDIRQWVAEVYGLPLEDVAGVEEIMVSER